MLACTHTPAKPSAHTRPSTITTHLSHAHTQNSHSRCRYVKRGRGFRFAVTTIFRPRDVRRALGARTTTLTAMHVEPKVSVRLRKGVEFEIVHLVFFSHLRPPNEVYVFASRAVYTTVPPHKTATKNVCVCLCVYSFYGLTDNPHTRRDLATRTGHIATACNFAPLI